MGKLEQLVAVEYAAAMLGEHLQELELHRRDGDLGALGVEQLVRVREEACNLPNCSELLTCDVRLLADFAPAPTVRRSTAFTRASNSRRSTGLAT